MGAMGMDVESLSASMSNVVRQSQSRKPRTAYETNADQVPGPGPGSGPIRLGPVSGHGDVQGQGRGQQQQRQPPHALLQPLEDEARHHIRELAGAPARDLSSWNNYNQGPGGGLGAQPSSAGQAGQQGGYREEEEEDEMWAWEQEAESMVPLRELLVSAQDTQVKPIIFNKHIEVLEAPSFKAASLPFLPHPPEDVAALSPDRLEEFLTEIYKALASKTLQVAGKVHVLAYLYPICKFDTVANIVINSSFATLLLQVSFLSHTSPMPSHALPCLPMPSFHMSVQLRYILVCHSPSSCR